MVWPHLDAKQQAAQVAAQGRRCGQIEHQAPASVAEAQPQQGWWRQGERQALAVAPHRHAHLAEQAGHLYGHLVVEAALLLGRALQAAAIPLQLQLAATATHAANAQLVLQHLQRQPQFGRLAPLAEPQPAGPLLLGVDRQPPAPMGAAKINSCWRLLL